VLMLLNPIIYAHIPYCGAFPDYQATCITLVAKCLHLPDACICQMLAFATLI